MSDIYKFNLTAVLLSATVISTPSPASTLPQTLSEQRNLFAPIHQAQTDIAKLPQLVSVCFITDAGNCAGLENDEGWNLDNEDRCKEEGYDCTPCPGGSEAVDICPYSGNCHKSCKNTCDSAYNKSCNGADETGKGDSCNGLYKECCNLCSDYPYTDGNLPTGYVKSDSCNSCSGTKYKASCDTSYKYQCVDDGYDGNANKNGGSGASCDGKYKACNCKSGYNWNATTGTCDISCDPAYKFDCIKSSITHISGGDGSACDSKYQRCTCTSPYTWSTAANACTCPSTYKYTCSGTGYSGGSGTACDGKYTACTCKSGYEWKNGTCTKTCDTSYKYTCTNLNETGGSGDSCNNKYKSCTCKSGYIWKNGACIKDCTGCNIGCIYFSDKTCSSIKESGKTPLGVVAYKNGSNMQIIALKNAADESTAFWTTNNTKANSVNLPDYSTETAAAKDIDSCGNTAAIIATGNSSTFPGVYAAYNYRPTGTPSGQNWCLPAAGVLASIRDNITLINDSIKTAGGTMLGKVGLNWYWSSTFQKHSTSLTYIWNYKTGSTGEYNSLDKSIADHSSGWESLRTSFIFRSVLDVSSCSSSYKYTCTGTGYSGGYGTACGGKYTACTCQSGYTWQNGSCVGSASSDPCDGKSNGANGNYYCCNNDVVGVKTSSMNFYVAMNDAGSMSYRNASYSCQNYSFCSGVKGSFPSKEDFTIVYQNKSTLSNLLTSNGGTSFQSYGDYWVSPDTYYINMGNGKVTQAAMSEGNTHKNVRPILSTSSSGGGSPCSGKSNGANGNYYCCDNDVVGVKTSSMNFYVAMKDIGEMNWTSAYTQSQNYSFCGNTKGTLPTKDQLVTIYNNKSSINNLLSANNGSKITSYFWYWSSSYEYTSRHYIVYMSDGDIQSGMDQNSNYVRPILSTSSSGGGSPCSGKSNGANGNYYCCNNDIVGVKTSSMNFYVAMKDIGEMNWTSANQACKNHVFCDNIKGKLPNKEQLLTIYNNLSAINSILYNVNGNKIGTEFYYWTSEYYGNPGYYYYYYINMLFGDEYESYLGHNNCYSIPIL